MVEITETVPPEARYYGFMSGSNQNIPDDVFAAVAALETPEALPAYSAWRVSLWLDIARTGALDFYTGINVQWTVPAGATFQWSWPGYVGVSGPGSKVTLDDTAGLVGVIDETQTLDDLYGAADYYLIPQINPDTNTWALFEGTLILDATAGVFGPQVAQITAFDTDFSLNTDVKRGSSMTMWRIA